MFSGLSVRSSCFDCHFKQQSRHSDITIWDCFDVDNYDHSMNNGKGATKALINSEKGKLLFEQASKEFNYKQFTDYELIYNNYEMFNAPDQPKNRDKFFEELTSHDQNKVFDDFARISIKDKLKNSLKLIAIKQGGVFKNESKAIEEKKERLNIVIISGMVSA